jgi:hypothetical protein
MESVLPHSERDPILILMKSVTLLTCVVIITLLHPILRGIDLFRFLPKSLMRFRHMSCPLLISDGLEDTMPFVLHEHQQPSAVNTMT